MRALLQSSHRLCQSNFGPVQTGQKQPRFAIDKFTDDASVLERTQNRLFDNLFFDLNEVGCPPQYTRFGITAMAITCQLLERVMDSGSGPATCIAKLAVLTRKGKRSYFLFS